MKNKSLALAIAAMLSACGGGSDSGNGGAPDAAVDSFTLKAQVSGLSGTATLTDGRGAQLSIGGDGEHTLARLAGGTPYSIAVARQPESQVCLVDEPNGIIGGDVAVRVDCADGIGLTLGTSTYSVAQLVLVDVPGEPSAVTASIGGLPVVPVPHHGAFAFVMPDLAPGTHVLEVQAHGRVFRKNLTVTANPLAEPAPDYLARRATTALAAMDAAAASADLSAEERALAQALKGQIEAALPGIAGLPADEALRVARALAANENLAGGPMPALLQVKAPGCLTHAKVFATGVVIVAGSIQLAGASVTSGPGVALFSAVALGGAVTGVLTLRDGFNGVMDKCLDRRKLVSHADASDVTGSGPRRDLLGVDPAPAARATKSAALPGGAEFDHGIARKVNPAIVMRLSDEIASGVLAQARALALKYEALREWASSVVTLPRIALLDDIAALQRESLRRADPAELEIQTSKPAIGAHGKAEGNQLAMTFRFVGEPMPEEPVPFGFRLRNPQLGIASDATWASLRPPSSAGLPDVRVQVFKDGPVGGELAGGERQAYEVTEAPANGTVTLADPVRGRFIYMPRTGFVGADRFGYVAHDADGTSLTGTVFVEVAENCIPYHGDGYQTLECRYSELDDMDFHPWSHTALVTPTLQYGPLPLEGRPGYIGYYESSSSATGSDALAPSGKAVQVEAYRVERDAVADRFTISGSRGYYDAVSEARVPRSYTDWHRGQIVRHPNGGYMYESSTRASMWLEVLDGESYTGELMQRTASRTGYREDGSPTYAGQTVYCLTSRWPEDGKTVGTTWVSIYNDSDVAGQVQVAQYEGNCPITEQGFAQIATETRPSDLRLDWRTGAPR